MDRSEYLQRVFGSDPLNEPSRLLALRAHYLGLGGELPPYDDEVEAAAGSAPPATSAAPVTSNRPAEPAPPAGPAPPTTSVDPAARRVLAAEALDQLRKELWGLSPEAFQARQDQLALDPFPDLEAGLQRLRQAAAARDELADLTDRFGAEKPASALVATLGRVLVATPDEAAALRDLFSQRCHSLPPAARKKIHRVIKHVRRHCPRLLQLEQSWLHDLTVVRKPPRTSSLSLIWRVILALMLLSMIGQSLRRCLGS